METWNPFLVAVAYKRIEIVKYFMTEMRASLMIIGRDPMQVNSVPNTREEEVISECFALKLAIINKDLAIL